MMKGILCAVVVLAILLPAGPGRADIYSYVDGNGIRHYTNVPGDSRYRQVRLPGLKPVASRVVRTGSRAVVLAGKARKHRVARTWTGPRSYDRHIRRAASRHRVDPLLIKAIIQTESNFNPRAISSHGAQGLMQLMPETARDLQVKNPFDPGQNIAGGTRYFRRLLDWYNGDLALSLAAYNAGPGRVPRHGSIPRIPETMAYVNKVLGLYRSYRRGMMVQATRINVRKLVTVH
ncbi:transglycosylase SLT domain-containing protein [Thermodesulfobacteriota bacterium B35]